MFVLKRTDQGGGYHSRPGSEHSYTRNLEKARIFDTRADAERAACENERALSVAEILEGNRDR